MPSCRFPPALSGVPFQITGLCSSRIPFLVWDVALYSPIPLYLLTIAFFLSTCTILVFIFVHSKPQCFPLFQLLSQTTAVLLSACFLFDYKYVEILVGIYERKSCSAVSDSLRPHGLYSPWNSPGQDAGVGSLSLLQGIFPTQGSNPGLPHCRQILYQPSHKGSPRILEWVSVTPHQFYVFLQSTHSDVSHPVQLPCF